MSMSTTSALSTRHLVYRIGASVLGGYVFVWGFIALILAGFYALGMEFHDAEALGNILGFLLYLVVFLWGFAARNVNRVWLMLAGGGIAMAITASLIQHSLI
jgi:hypothetical protein